MVMQNWWLSVLLLIIFPVSLYFLFLWKRRINKEMEEIDESNDQELIISDDSAEGYEYEVFLSFRGADTRTNFTDHLYRHLRDLRIQTFRDNENLHVGGEIGPKLMEAIEQAKILIPIFSKGYASSKWCLMELAHMVKCVEGSKERAMICPIFYDVTPSEVRKQTGSFKEAFVRHAEGFDKETVKEWKEALKTVSYLKGWEKDQIANGHESELVKEVGTKVLMELKKMHVEVTKHLVGMDQQEAELMQLLDLDCNDVKIVEIVGMGGIGKTTLAKVVYNKLCDQFHQRCGFLEDVREKVKQSGGLDDLKKQLMSDILKRTSGRMQMNQSTFKSTKALIVVDDVADRSQLEKIIGGCDWFGPGSRIIVTTRNRDTFIEQEQREGEKIYEPREMNPDNALLLFCKHAFRRDFPREGYEDLSRKVVSKVAGLPLSLEVIGSLLSTKKREVWDETLKKLEKIMPKEVQERLQISYDMLDDGQKDIFLDIACHFIYSDKDERAAASYMWEDCGFFPVSGIDALITLSLVKSHEYGHFTMHDQLRDLGREFVRKQGPQNPGDRSRLWTNEVAREVLTSKRGTERVQTLTLDSYCRDRLSNEEFKGLYHLRYLDLHRSNLTGDFKGIFSNLRWFRWHPVSQIAVTNFCLPKLVVLDLSRSNISDGWEDWIQIKEATNLKVLDLPYCHNLSKTPDLSAFSKLERLNLQGCGNLVEISPSIRHLQHLNYLNLNYCYDCREEVHDNTSSESKWRRPEFFWNLKSLVELHLKKLRLTELSEAIGNLTNLTILDVGDSGIKKLPNEFGKLNKLEKLDASECKSLEELPETVGDLRSLRLLVIKKSGIKRLPNAIGWLEKLEELNARDCAFLGELPESIGNLTNLRRLDIGKSRVIRLPSAIGRLEKLEWLDARDCTFLGELPESIGNLTNLRRLDIRKSRVKRLPSAIGLLEKLERLDASECKSLGELPESIGNLRNLRILCVSSSGIKKLPAGIGMLQKQEELDCSCSSLEGELLSGVWSLSALTELSLYNTKISSLLLPADLSCYSHLRILDLGSCPDLRLPPSGLKLPPGLEAVEIPLTKASLDSVVRLPKLKTLGFHQCDRTDLVEFPIDLGGLPHELEKLLFYGFENYTSLPVKINYLPWPRVLCIGSGVTNNVKMRWSDVCESLVLELDGCESLERLPDLSNALEKIRIHNCPKLFDIDSLSVLTSLTTLDIENCPSLESLPDFSALNRLGKLKIYECEKLRKIRGLEALRCLGRLRLRDCPSLEKLPDLSHLNWKWFGFYMYNCGPENKVTF